MCNIRNIYNSVKPFFAKESSVNAFNYVVCNANNLFVIDKSLTVAKFYVKHPNFAVSKEDFKNLMNGKGDIVTTEEYVTNGILSIPNRYDDNAEDVINYYHNINNSILEEQEIHYINNIELEKIISYTDFCSDDMLRPSLTGISFSKELLFASESHIIKYENLTTPIDIEFIIPNSSNEIKAIKGIKEKNIDIVYYDKAKYASIRNIDYDRYPKYNILYRTIDSTPVNPRELIAQERENYIIFSKKSLLDFVNAIPKDVTSIKFKVKNNILILNAKDIDLEYEANANINIHKKYITDEYGENHFSDGYIFIGNLSPRNIKTILSKCDGTILMEFGDKSKNMYEINKMYLIAGMLRTD
jgi:hypothetical protein